MSAAPRAPRALSDPAPLRMPGRRPKTGGVLRLAALLCAGALLGGCGTDETGGGGRVPGETLSVVSLLPLSGPEAPVARDLLRGQKLALAEAGGRVGKYDVTMRAIDDAPRKGADARRAAAQATRLALSETQAIAVMGPLGFESAQVAVPLLNASGLLQVSPTVGYRGLSGRAAAGEPEQWLPAGRRTFRAAGDEAAQAAVTIDAVRAASGRARPRVTIEREAGADDVALAESIATAASARGAEVVEDPIRADAVVYVGSDAVAAEGVASDLAREAPDALVVYGEDLTRAGLDRRMAGPAARRAVFVSRAPRPRSTPRLRRFHRRYAERFGAAPGPYAALGHAAMRSLLDGGIARAGGRAAERDRVAEVYLQAPPELPAPSAFRMRGGRRAYLPLGGRDGG